ncbi:MAG: FtsQ-type POTRA domain-containing protein [Gemmatimonadetes bacterium]|nr:FtsQ-type POTRA domain-containing protein [Gemmatimonadota bacterium]
MRRRWVVLIAVLALAGVAAGTPLALRQVGFFRVRRVELVGVRYLAPDSVIAALALRPDQNVFDDADPIQRRAAALAGVVSAKVEHRLPGTLRISILEREPVAFAPGPDRLVALDGEGQPLPYNPAATGLDLPLIARADTALVRTLSVIRLADSALFQEIDAASRGPRGAIHLEVGGTRVLWSGIPSPDEVRAIGAVRRHLASTGRRYGELDARFEGWVVVRRSTA